MVTCLTCKREFTSQKALNAHQVSHKQSQRYSKSRGRSEVKCLACRSSIKKKPSSKAKFCNNKCQADYDWQNKKQRILQGEAFGMRPMRRYLVEADHSCRICGQGPTWNGLPLTLQVDHIDGDSDNNVIGNLRLLCPHCHSQTSTWCARNHKNSNRSKYNRVWRKTIQKQQPG